MFIFEVASSVRVASITMGLRVSEQVRVPLSCSWRMCAFGSTAQQIAKCMESMQTKHLVTLSEGQSPQIFVSYMLCILTTIEAPLTWACVGLL